MREGPGQVATERRLLATGSPSASPPPPARPPPSRTAPCPLAPTLSTASSPIPPPRLSVCRLTDKPNDEPTERWKSRLQTDRLTDRPTDCPTERRSSHFRFESYPHGGGGGGTATCPPEPFHLPPIHWTAAQRPPSQGSHSLTLRIFPILPFSLAP